MSRAILHQLCHLAAAGLMLGAFAEAGVWWGVILLPALALFGLLPRRRRPGWSASALLVGYAGCAAGGLVCAVAPQLLIAGAAAALAGWELDDPGPGLPEKPAVSRMSPVEKQHLFRLGSAIAAGLGAAEAGTWLNISLPFGVQFFIALVVLYSLFQLVSCSRRFTAGGSSS